jgi:alpha-glucosidase (family GH31 glycosyl hydrolase)
VWFSREYPFSRPQITDVIRGYSERQLPLNMLVLDYQWHYGPGDVQDVAGCNQPKPGGFYNDCTAGFGGYVWNKKLFPDPLDFTEWLHNDANLSLVLNIHDPCGIDVCQEGYNVSAVAAGIDPASKQPIPCQMTNKTYATSLTER